MLHPPAARTFDEPVPADPCDVASSAGALDGCDLLSHFQPIFSFTHSRRIGCEALLRARTRDGAPIAPLDLFAACRTADALIELNHRALRQHLRAYRADATPEWLFVNIHPLALGDASRGSFHALLDAFATSGIPAERIVVEVLETSAVDVAAVDRAVAQLKAFGCLIAIDDFGAGHSNFERVFRLEPDIVKLDRNVIVRAMADKQGLRVVERMVALLHECGCLVLMEGIETADGAFVALCCDVDFVQGYHFGRPGPVQASADDGKRALACAWSMFDRRSHLDRLRWEERLAPYRDALRQAGERLEAGDSFERSSATFLSLPHGDMCFLLDAEGRERAPRRFRDGFSLAVLDGIPQFAPLRDSDGARWARRPYFRDAGTLVEGAKCTRPYLTLQGGRMCVTLSLRCTTPDGPSTVCGDVSWPSDPG